MVEKTATKEEVIIIAMCEHKGGMCGRWCIMERLGVLGGGGGMDDAGFLDRKEAAQSAS